MFTPLCKVHYTKLFQQCGVSSQWLIEGYGRLCPTAGFAMGCVLLHVRKKTSKCCVTSTPWKMYAPCNRIGCAAPTPPCMRYSDGCDGEYGTVQNRQRQEQWRTHAYSPQAHKK
ncbi:hypothetical protein TcCL_NonESM07159 [Trypanosoma cruzi]|nr:hypothetical protein TcCL_NonESM07159 [Trypanosoma cruzi]